MKRICKLKDENGAVPMVESWPFSISYREGGGHHMASLNSQDRLNLILTPAAFRSIGDLYCFSKLVSVLPDKARRSMPAGFSRGLMKALATSREKMSTLYRLAADLSSSLRTSLSFTEREVLLVTSIWPPHLYCCQALMKLIHVCL